jgi:nucleoside-diphosphate-sugar epimerase
MAAVLVTGASGFVGGAVVDSLAAVGRPVLGVSRSVAGGQPFAPGPGLAPDSDWRHLLNDVDAIVHAAARVHVMRDQLADPLAEYRAVNVAGTLRLARQAADAGVRRFVFISSIKVNGESTGTGTAFRADDAPAPGDPYGVSKMEAEQGLERLASETGMEVAIIRPPLVYGPGVKANFEALMRWLSRGVPLPLGAVENRRSLVALANLVDLITTCIDHPAAANQVFLASDDDDLSTTALLRRLATALGKPARLIPVPPSLLELGASLLGKGGVAQRLLSNLQVDIAKTKERLGWQPPVSVDRALELTARDFLGRGSA